MQICNDLYGWRGSLILMAAFMLNGCAVSLLMVPYCSLEELARGKMQAMDDECQSKELIKSSFSEEDFKNNEIKSPLSECKSRSYMGSLPIMKSTLSESRSRSHMGSLPTMKSLSSEFRSRSDVGSVLTLSPQNIATLDSPAIDSEEGQSSFLAKFTKMFNLSLLRNPATAVALMHWFFVYLSSSVISTFLPTVTSQYGIQGTTSSLMLSAMGLSCFLGRVISGFFASIPRIQATYVVMVLSAAYSSCYLVLTWIRCAPGFFTVASITGFIEGEGNFKIDHGLGWRLSLAHTALDFRGQNITSFSEA